jgi:REP element-mobilizing transposase RayT
MRQARIKIAAEAGEAVYHCMSRSVNGERLFEDQAKEILRRQFWQVAEYCGVEILTYVVLSNHFHVLVKVPQKAPVSDAELLRRYEVLYPHPTRYQAARLEVIKKELASNGPEAQSWRRWQLALMGDISPFMKLVKLRFSIWYNHAHRRFGTLWAERFKSVLIEPRGLVVATVAAYIDLNSVRAGLAEDPKDYRFCGYAEAVAGSAVARRNLASVIGVMNWDAAQAAYRLMLFGTAAGTREHGAAITPEALESVVAAGGRLPLATVLRCRLRYFSDGAVLGSRVFVEEQLMAYRLRTGRRERNGTRLLPSITDWGELAALRGVRRAFG